MKHLLAALALFGVLVLSRPASAEDDDSVHAFGFARAIPRSTSASRDAPAFGLMMAPRGIRTASTEAAFLTIPAGPVTIRPGFYGLIELEGDGDAEVTLWPSQEIHFWRGSFAFPIAVSFDAWARALCKPCMLEASMQFRHESEHYTGDNSGRTATDYSDRPIYGDAIGLDLAGTTRWHDVVFLVRPALDVFLPDRSSYVYGVSLDAQVRYARWNAQPFLSGFALYRSGASTERGTYPDAYLLRALSGVAFTSKLGEVALFFSGDVGHRIGLAAYTREATVGFGVRLSLGVMPKPR